VRSPYLALCAWAGPVFAGFYLIGYFVTGFVPPIDPAADAETVSAIYKDNYISMRIGFVLMMVSLSLQIPFIAAITVQMKAMKNYSPSLSFAFIIAQTVAICTLYFVLCAWGVATFRLDRMPELIQAFNDFAFILLIWPVSILPIAYIALGIATLNDDQPSPVFPRWFGFYNFWMALLAYGGVLLLFFHDGPFAWDGLFSFWLAAFAFFGWYIVTSILLVLSLRREQA